MQVKLETKETAELEKAVAEEMDKEDPSDEKAAALLEYERSECESE